MKIFVTGVGGQLGHDVMNELAKRGYEGVGSDIAPEYSGAADGSAVTKMPYVQLDITDKEAVEKVLTEIKPDVVVHCAAWTAVDLAEDDDKVEKVRKVNVTGTENIALACKKLDCKMVYLSTDYVFDGMGTEPWQPDCKTYKPLNVYGETKLGGELAVSDFAHSLFVDDKTPLHPVNSSEPFVGSARSFDTCRYTPKHIYRYRMPRIQHFRYGLSEILQLFVSLLHHFAQLLREV